MTGAVFQIRIIVLFNLNKNASADQFNKLIDRFTDKRIKPVNPGYYLALAAIE